MSNEECLQRLANNESDFANTLVKSQSMSPYLHHPEPIFTGKTQFISGYQMVDGEWATKDSATVFSNADLYQSESLLDRAHNFSFTFAVRGSSCFCDVNDEASLGQIEVEENHTVLCDSSRNG